MGSAGEVRRSAGSSHLRDRRFASQIALLRVFNRLSSFECATHGRCSEQARGNDLGSFVLRHSNPAAQTAHDPRHTESSVFPPSFLTYGVYPCNSYENSNPYAFWTITTGGSPSVLVLHAPHFRTSDTRPIAAVNQEVRVRQCQSTSGPKSPCRIPHGMGLPLGHPSREGLRAAKILDKKEVRRSAEKPEYQSVKGALSAEKVRNSLTFQKMDEPSRRHFYAAAHSPGAL